MSGRTRGVPAASRERRKAELLDVIQACDGAEVHKDDWKYVESLVAEGKATWTGGARGPGREWRRAEPVVKTMVYVIMGNDYPSRVYADQAKAEAFVAEKTREEKEMEAKPIHNRPRGRIYWRSYEFELIE